MTAQAVAFNITPEQEASKLQFLRRQFFGYPPVVSREDVDLSGKTAIVTGANGGLGLECCRQLLELGISKLIMAVRDEAKGEAARESLLAAKPTASQPTIEVWKLDYASYESVVAFAKRAEALQPRLDIAILNAGVNRALFSLNPETGHEENLQTNYLSTALLALLLLRIFQPTAAGATSPASSSPGRIVLVSSDVAAWVPFGEQDQEPLLPAFDEETRFESFGRYGTTKLLGQLFVAELARRVPSAAAVVNCANPGLCYGAAINRDLGVAMAVFTRLIGRSCAAGARSLVNAAVAQDERSHGQYIEDCEIRPMAPFVYSKQAELVTQRLWKETMDELSFAGVEKTVEHLSRSTTK